MAVRWTWQPEVGGLSPIIEIDGVAGSLCHPKRGLQVSSMAALDGAMTTAYFYESGNLYMRVLPGVEGELFCGTE